MNTKEYDAYLISNERNKEGTQVYQKDSNKSSRPSWQRYFMDIALLAAKRSTCERRQVGAVAVKENRILAVGYNGAPSGMKHCAELGGCLRKFHNIPSGERRDLCRAIHAEQNLLVQAAIHGISLQGCDIYCNCSPCSDCTKMLISLGVKRFYYLERYPDTLVDQFVEDAGMLMKLVKLED